jgi:polyisoprenoid-binding protein YceI
MILMTLISWLLFNTGPGKPAQLLMCKDAKTTLYSEAPLENIEATSIKGKSVLNTSTGEVQFSIPITSFEFKKSLMQEHFNENYMESDKYPVASFNGKINEKIDAGQPGDFPVTATGELQVHGVKKQRTINGTLKITKTGASLNSKFIVACKDHGIKIPTLVFKNIAETIQVTVSANYIPYSK